MVKKFRLVEYGGYVKVYKQDCMSVEVNFWFFKGILQGVDLWFVLLQMDDSLMGGLKVLKCESCGSQMVGVVKFLEVEEGSQDG